MCTSKALHVHLEIVSNYSTDAFLAALRRFTARCGLCHSLHSDCGTNFVGVDAQSFNPPSAPHFGDLWKTAVKFLKHHLRGCWESRRSPEEISTLLTQIKACINSRPLQALTDDPDDVAALTPGHFLVGAALNAIPEPHFLDAPIVRLSRWQLLQKMHDHFWSRWSQE
ncbi:hypothetical protein ACFW04_011498 [Cataglyphis niger]